METESFVDDGIFFTNGLQVICVKEWVHGIHDEIMLVSGLRDNIDSDMSDNIGSG